MGEMQPCHRTFVQVSVVLPLQCLKAYSSRHDIYTIFPINQCDQSLSAFNSQTTAWPNFLLKWLSEQSLFINVKVWFFWPLCRFFCFFLWLICSLLFIFILFCLPYFFFVGVAWGIFLVVIWFLTVLFFLDSEFVFLWFWPENLFFVQVIFLSFFLCVVII